MVTKITKAVLAEKLEDMHPNLTERRLMVDALFIALTALLARRKNINIKRVGRLTIRKKVARPGRNPKTGKDALIKPRTTVTLSRAKTDYETAGLGEIIEQVIYSASKLGVTLNKSSARKLVMLLWDAIASVSEGNTIEIRGFGTFSPKVIPARSAHNPKTLEKVHVPGYTKVYFKVSRSLVQLLS